MTPLLGSLRRKLLSTLPSPPFPSISENLKTDSLMKHHFRYQLESEVVTVF